MKELKIYTEYVTLGQFLKIAHIIQTGGEAKLYLSQNIITINGEVDNRRGRKLRNNDIVLIGKEEYKILNEN